MKNLLLVLIVLLVPTFASAQETYSGPASAGQQADVAGMVTANNGAVCAATAQSPGCTQAQACAGATPAIPGCTAAQARAAGVRIFAQTFAGREEFFQFRIALPKFLELRAEIVNLNQAYAKRTWDAGNQTVKDGMCTAAGLSAGCLLYQ